MKDAAEGECDDANDGVVRDWIQRSMETNGPTVSPPRLLAGVQRRIRLRSRGKFFSDGWSTEQTRASQVWLGVITVFLVALACYAMGPWHIR